MATRPLVLQGYLPAHGEAVLACACILTYACLLFLSMPPTLPVDYASLAFEGTLAVLPLVGMFMISDLKETQGESFWVLFVGMAALGVSMATDTLDEVVRMPEFYNTVCEGLLQVIGFGLLLLGLRGWLDWNEQLKARLAELATTDYLTGAANRRHFMEVLARQIALGELHGRPLSLVMIDLDSFKEINDTYGHDVGDKQLRKVARVVREHSRSSDLFARYGGEEFALLAPMTRYQGALAMAENIRMALQHSTDGGLPPVTASFGVVQYTGRESADDLLKRADLALYAAKQQGRNCVA